MGAMMGYSLLLTAAVIPAIVLMVVIYLCDRTEKEPVGLIMLVMLLGAVTIIPAAIIEMMGGAILELICGIIPLGFLQAFIENYFIVAITEEILKWAVIMIFIWRHKEFNYRFDGIVYCVASSLGFALVENIMYVFQYGFGTAITRALFSIPGHCTFAIMMGYFLGQSKLFFAQRRKGLGFLFMILSLAVPMVIHGTYDFLLSAENLIFTLAFLMLIFIVDGTAIGVVIVRAHQDMPFYGYYRQ